MYRLVNTSHKNTDKKKDDIAEATGYTVTQNTSGVQTNKQNWGVFQSSDHNDIAESMGNAMNRIG